MKKRHPLVQKMVDICNEKQDIKVKKLVAMEDHILGGMENNYTKMAETVKRLSTFLPANKIMSLLKKCGLTDEDISIILQKLEK